MKLLSIPELYVLTHRNNFVVLVTKIQYEFGLAFFSKHGLSKYMWTFALFLSSYVSKSYHAHLLNC